MKIVTLIENTTCWADLQCEHGLSLYIEASGIKILFDSDASGDFADNADVWGINLREVDLAVLSHGHDDHSGGFHYMRVEPSDPMLEASARTPLRYPTVYYTGHCTGQAQFDAMKKIMANRLHDLSTGTVIEL